MKSTIRFSLAVLAAALTLAGSGSAFAEGNAAEGKIKAIPCMGCHGIPGYQNVYPTYHVPRVGGQHPEYIIAALKAYKLGERGHRTMQAQAATLSDQDMADIAAYFAGSQDSK